MRRSALGLVLAALAILLTAPLAGAYTPVLEPVHAQDGHASAIQDLDYNGATDRVWSVAEDGGVIGYDIENDQIVAERGFERGHAIATSDGEVHVAAADTLWTYDLEAEEWSQLATLQDHAADMEYDVGNDVLWVAGGETVTGYDATDGSVVASHEQHTDGLETIAVDGERGLVASGTTWSDEVLVWDVEEETVAHEPEVPGDVGSISSLEFTRDGELLIGTDAESESWVGMVDLQAGETVAEHRVHVFAVSGVEHLAEQDVIVSTGLDNSVRLYDVQAGNMVDVYEHADTIYTAELSDEDELLWVGDGEERTGQVTAIDVADQHVSSGEDTDDETADPDAGADAGDDEATEDTSPAGGDADEADESPAGLAVAVLGVALALAVAGRRGRDG